MILSCSHLSKAFGSKSVIADASFHIEDHEKAAIVGINGAGKSTLLKMITAASCPPIPARRFWPRGRPWDTWPSTRISPASGPFSRS